MAEIQIEDLGRKYQPRPEFKALVVLHNMGQPMNRKQRRMLAKGLGLGWQAWRAVEDPARVQKPYRKPAPSV